MNKDRRKFLKESAAAVVALGAGTKSLASTNKLDRPNILLVLDDQERQPMHTPPLSLPNRERLKPHAVEFTHAFCSYPLCSPSRATVMTGRYPHQVGILNNVDFAARNPSLPRNVPNIGGVFSEAGYRTVYFGKWHLSLRAHSVGNLLRYGFESPHVSNQLYAIGSDPKVTRNAANWIRRDKSKKPWLMVYSPINPHDICFPFLDGVYKGDYRHNVSLPPNYSPTRAPDIKTLQDAAHGYKILENLLPESGNEENWLRYLRFYCWLVEDVDRNLGRVLDALVESGQWDNTVVIFTSDHGEMGASHGLPHKSPTMYEENLRVPLWISDPRRMSGFRQCDELVSNLDLAPTICSIAGIKWPEPVPGISLDGILEGGEEIGRDHIFAEGGLQQVASWRGVRTKEWKYWHYDNGEELLFNIAEDPLEMNNLAPDKETEDVLVRFRDKVRDWRRDTNDPIKRFIA